MSFYGNRVPRGWVQDFPLANHSPTPPSLRPGAAELLGIKEPEPEIMEAHEELDGFDPEQDTDEEVAKDLISLAAERVFVPSKEPEPAPEEVTPETVVSPVFPEEPKDDEEDTGPEVLVASTAKKKPGRPKKSTSRE
jgi:hypothetical protein